MRGVPVGSRGRAWRFAQNPRGNEHADQNAHAIRGQVAGVEEKPKPKVDFEPGELVRITDGPFMNSSGVVQSIDHDHGRLTVMVTIFGGETPVDLEYWQVEREAPAAPEPHVATK